ncbi:hypothetical protein [Chamaesiphon sp.]|uniref:hypothetical protein n=1 Tax=Chamaesiphon sp. TaxID=2814140 RepID=UPI00359426A5
MNFKSILVLGLSVATLGLALPAHADTATVINSTQDAIVTGDYNDTVQKNTTTVKNQQSGRRSAGATGTSITSGQSADVQGFDNTTRQNNKTNVVNTQRNSR